MRTTRRDRKLQAAEAANENDFVPNKKLTFAGDQIPHVETDEEYNSYDAEAAGEKEHKFNKKELRFDDDVEGERLTMKDVYIGKGRLKKVKNHFYSNHPTSFVYKCYIEDCRSYVKSTPQEGSRWDIITKHVTHRHDEPLTKRIRKRLQKELEERKALKKMRLANRRREERELAEKRTRMEEEAQASSLFLIHKVGKHKEATD